MIKLLYLNEQGRLVETNDGILIWIDAISATFSEISTIEEELQLNISSTQDAISFSLPLHFITEGELSYSHIVSFKLLPKILFTSRLSAFPLITETRIAKSTPLDVLFMIIGEILDQNDKNLGLIATNLEELSERIFSSNKKKIQTNLHDILTSIGHNYNLTSNTHSSLTKLIKQIHVLQLEIKQLNSNKINSSTKKQFKKIFYVAESLNSHSELLATKCSYLQDACLGLVNIQQNQIIKMFSVVSVVFLPPTLIASSYGMNFDNMPELHWSFGYPFSIILMILSAVLPIFIFKKQGWF